MRKPKSANRFLKDQCNDGSNFTLPRKSAPLTNPEVLDAAAIDCSKCVSIPHAFCLAEAQNGPNLARMDFNDMVEKMQSEHVCTCSDGYLPVYDQIDGSLVRCHDPIIATSVINGRCLSQSHCMALANSYCAEEPNVKLANGLPIKTCQCMSGYIDKKFGCDLDVESGSHEGN